MPFAQKMRLQRHHLRQDLHGCVRATIYTLAAQHAWCCEVSADNIRVCQAVVQHSTLHSSMVLLTSVLHFVIFTLV